MKKLPKLIRWILSVGLIFLVVFTLMRIGLFSFFSRQNYSLGDVKDAFFLGLRYDLRIISLVLILMLILGSLPWLSPFRSRRAANVWTTILGVITVLVLFLFMVDFAHYAYLVQRLNASVMNYMKDTGISLNMIWESYPVIWLMLALVVGTTFIVWLIKRSYRRIDSSNEKPARPVRVVSFIVTFLVTGFFIFGKFNQYPLRWSDAFNLGSDYKANLALNPFESFFNTLKFRKSSYNEEKVREGYAVLAPYFNLSDSGAANLDYKRVVMPKPGGMTAKPNIVLVICESFSAYKSSMWGNPLATTPFMDTLCRNGIFFDRCFTPTYGTARGVWATITGIPDVETPTTASRNPLAVDQHTIINDFEDYEKFYFIGGSSSWANIRGLLKNNIHNLNLYEGGDYKASAIDVWGISDKNLFLESNGILAQQQKPFFAIIQTADNHRPYTIPEEDRAEFAVKKMSRDSLRKYGFESEDEMNAFRYTDFCFRKFMEAAKKEKYYDNTIFVFVGDHGIPGDAGNMFSKAWTAQRLTAEHVPLVFYSPAFLQPRRLSVPCSQVDVLPTIAGICNIKYTNTALGRDALDSTTRHFAFIFDPDFNMTGVIKDDYFYRRQYTTNKEEMVSVVDNNNPHPDSTDAQKKEMKRLTDAMFETAKYMILHNKKVK
ncbi:MAG: sulfatase-like hydrolase/transferase [Chitinophagaceae bacterium]